MKMYERINAKNWCKDTLMDAQGRRCLIGHAVGITGDNEEAEELLRRVGEAINALYPERGIKFMGVSPSMRAFSFNDDCRTTVEDVIRVCKVADV